MVSAILNVSGDTTIASMFSQSMVGPYGSDSSTNSS